ncbi:MAG: polymerase primary sigma factor [Solirubrobacteraceae bacterium]
MIRGAAAERALVAAAQADAPGSRESLVETFVPLIASVARIYRGSPAVDRAELMQAGTLGLLRALERFDGELGPPFWAYASWWVRESMQQLVSELERPVVLSDRALRQLARVRDAHREHLQRHGREPSCAELASGAGLAREQVERLIAAERRPRALEEPVGGDSDGGSTFADLVADPAAEDAYDRVPSHIETAQLPPLLGELDSRERWIVRERFGLDGPARTLRELARNLGVSAERVRQVEQVALDKLRTALLETGLDGRGAGPTSGRDTPSAENDQRRQCDDDDHRAVRAVAARPQSSLHRRGGGRWVRTAG